MTDKEVEELEGDEGEEIGVGRSELEYCSIDSDVSLSFSAIKV